MSLFISSDKDFHVDNDLIYRNTFETFLGWAPSGPKWTLGLRGEGDGGGDGGGRISCPGPAPDPPAGGSYAVRGPPSF